MFEAIFGYIQSHYLSILHWIDDDDDQSNANNRFIDFPVHKLIKRYFYEMKKTRISLFIQAFITSIDYEKLFSVFVGIFT